MEIWRDTREESFDGEIWKHCEQAPLFEVSNFGRVRSNFNMDYGNGQVMWVGKIITQNPASKEKRYLRATLRVDGRDSSRSAFNTHRLVAKAFVAGETEERNEINHKDGVPENNRFDNLEWCTRQENVDHAVLHGLRWYFEGEAVSNSKFKVHQIEEILRRYYFGFEKLKDIASDYGVVTEYISLIIRGKRWKKVFLDFVEKNKDHYEKVKLVLRKRNGVNLHKFKSRIGDSLGK